ncbi:hypothetical protein [Streptomyces sp. NBC_01190]|uniref:hypothetical protein n=1 Tax=Streptomyces sp. NBC_01190 TaxID=2903767 RepID=UPI00386538A1|nr:hypothetical protein OG519_30600 [Streptomyces sp. NBC_01190]
MTDTRRRVSLTAAAGLGLCLALLPVGQAQAGQEHPPPSVPCGDTAALKTAITTANTSGGAITLAANCVYSLTEADNPDDGLPEITGTVRISGGDRTVIQRASSATGDFRIFHVAPGGSLGLDALTVRGGTADGTGYGAAGGGILNDQGTLKLTGVTVRSNRAGFIAGGIWNNLGTLVLKNTTIHDNASRIGGGVATSGTMTMEGGALRGNSSDSWGGALANAGDTKLNNVSVADNSSGLGGGIMTLTINNDSGPLSLESTQVTGNIAESSGGGVFIGIHEPTTLKKSTVTRNTANGGPTTGGGINNDGRLFGAIINPTALPQLQDSAATDAADPALPTVDLIDSSVVNNTPTNCAPPGSVPHCDNAGTTWAAPTAKTP